MQVHPLTLISISLPYRVITYRVFPWKCPHIGKVLGEWRSSRFGIAQGSWWNWGWGVNRCSHRHHEEEPRRRRWRRPAERRWEVALYPGLSDSFGPSNPEFKYSLNHYKRHRWNKRGICMMLLGFVCQGHVELLKKLKILFPNHQLTMKVFYLF